MKRREATAEQKARAAERRAKFRDLWQNVAKMPELERIQLSNKLGIVTCEGRALSVKNQCLLALQCPGASVVGGFRQWLKMGRCVRKGEHGHMIWIPAGKKQGSQSEPADAMTITQAESGDGAAEGPRFIIGTVFDIGQTVQTGDQIESPAEVPGELITAQ